MFSDATDPRRQAVWEAVGAIHRAIGEGGAISDDAPLTPGCRIICHLPSLPEFPMAGEWRGRDGLTAWLRVQAEGLEVLAFDVRAVEEAEDALVAMIDATLRHRESGAVHKGSVITVYELHEMLIDGIHVHIHAARLEAAVREAQYRSELGRV